MVLYRGGASVVRALYAQLYGISMGWAEQRGIPPGRLRGGLFVRARALLRSIGTSTNVGWFLLSYGR